MFTTSQAEIEAYLNSKGSGPSSTEWKTIQTQMSEILLLAQAGKFRSMAEIGQIPYSGIAQYRDRPTVTEINLQSLMGNLDWANRTWTKQLGGTGSISSEFVFQNMGLKDIQGLDAQEKNWIATQVLNAYARTFLGQDVPVYTDYGAYLIDTAQQKAQQEQAVAKTAADKAAADKAVADAKAQADALATQGDTSTEETPTTQGERFEENPDGSWNWYKEDGSKQIIYKEGQTPTGDTTTPSSAPPGTPAHALWGDTPPMDAEIRYPTHYPQMPGMPLVPLPEAIPKPGMHFIYNQRTGERQEVPIGVTEGTTTVPKIVNLSSTMGNSTPTPSVPVNSYVAPTRTLVWVPGGVGGGTYMWSDQVPAGTPTMATMPESAATTPTVTPTIPTTTPTTAPITPTTPLSNPSVNPSTGTNTTADLIPGVDTSNWSPAEVELFKILNDKLDALIQQGKMINPDIEITEEKAAEFIDQAKTEISPFYQTLAEQAKQDLQRVFNFKKTQLQAEEQAGQTTYERNLTGLSETMAESGLAYSGYRKKEEGYLADVTQRALDASRRALGYDVASIGTTAERTYGSRPLTGLEIPSVTGAPQVTAGQKAWAYGQEQPLYRLSPDITGTLEREQMVAEKTRSKELEAAYRALRAAEYYD